MACYPYNPYDKFKRGDVNRLVPHVTRNYPMFIMIGTHQMSILKNPNIAKDTIRILNKWDNEDTHKKLNRQTYFIHSVWNQNANDEIAQIFKKYNPNGIVVYGG